MRIGIIGYGSIGKRHIRNLITLGYEDIILLRKIGSGNENGFEEYNNIETLINKKPDAVIIANPTSLHYDYLSALLKENINLLVEKPLVSTISELESIQDQLISYFGVGMTAYNMRFHPCVKEVQKILENKTFGKLYSARFFVGQYLPDWRPSVDYSKSYSASQKLGGGVLFDLIHEIDLACYLVGVPTGQISYQVDNLSDLQIETEDMAELLYRTDDNSFVSIHLDYLTHSYQRYIEIIGEQGNLRADLYSNKVTVTIESGKSDEKFFSEFSRNDMYLDMLSAFITSIEKTSVPPISLQEGFLSNRIAIDIRSKFHGNE